jgi:hypothetical protein
MYQKRLVSVARAFQRARLILLAIGVSALVAPQCAFAQQPAAEKPASAEAAKTQTHPADQAALETSFAEMLSGATLEGSFTSTGAGQDPTKLSRDKYTIGQVRKTGIGNLWLIPARVQYGDRDFTVPVTVPVRWAGDTPIIAVDKVPGFDDMSARVMFFADHYAGYWKHGNHGGHLFGVIKRGDKAAAPQNGSTEAAPASIGDPAHREQSE